MRRRVDGHPLFKISDPRLHALLRELAPSILRIGGTAGDHWQFGGAPIVPNPAPAQFTVPPDIWDDVVTAFARRSSMQIVVGLSSFTRDKSNRWNSTNARGLAEYNLRRFGGSVFGYELGNEPGVWNWTWGVPIVTPEQHAADYAALRAVREQGVRSIATK